MKRDVKVGLFVAAVVIGITALLLGGGVLGGPRAAPPRLSMRAGGEDLFIPHELTDAVRPPDELLPVKSLHNGSISEFEPAEAFADAVAVEAPAEEIDDPFAVAADFDDWASLPAEPVAEVEPVTSAGAAPAFFELSEADLLALETEDARIALPATPKQIYVLQPGETFWDVSRKVYGEAKHFQAIVAANPDLDPRKLRPGQRIAIPVIDGVAADASVLASPGEVETSRGARVYLAEEKVHVVQPGELLEDIARTYYGYRHKWPHIQRANPGLDPRRMRVGDKVIVPALTE